MVHLIQQGWCIGLQLPVQLRANDQISDGYGGYNDIASIVNAYCWAHARRKFYEALPADMKDASDALAYTGLKKIAKLFAREKEIDTFPPEDKVKIR